MKKRYIITCCFVLFTFAIKGYAYPVNEGKYLGIAQHYADTMLKYGRDTYGAVKSPMFVDTLHRGTKQAYHWRISPAYQQQVIDRMGGFVLPLESVVSNFTFAQELLIVLREISKLTGDASYKNAANAAATWALKNIDKPGQIYPANKGLLSWGQHVGWDLINDQLTGGKGGALLHEMKTAFPDWQYMYQINPTVTKKEIEQLWNSSIRNWNTLEWGRHHGYSGTFGGTWSRINKINKNLPVPYVSTRDNQLYDAGSQLIVAAIMHWKLTGDESAWTAGYQLLKRFLDIRGAQTKLGPSMWVIDTRNGPDAVNFTSTGIGASTERDVREGGLMLQLSQIIGNNARGNMILNAAMESQKAWWKYRLIKNTPNYWRKLYIVDGLKFSNSTAKVAEPTLWSFALAYRLTKDQDMWNATRSVLIGQGFGDIGTAPGANVNLNFGSVSYNDYPDYSNNDQAFFVHTFVELYNATKKNIYLEMACKVADDLINDLYKNGLFARVPNGTYARTGHMMPLALIHLAHAIQGTDLEPGAVMPRKVTHRARNSDKYNGKDFPQVVASKKYDADFFLYFKDDINIPNEGNSPAGPTGLNLIESSGRVTIGWNDNSSNESGFILERKRAGDSFFKNIGTIRTNNTSKDDLPGNGRFIYRIRSRNSFGYSAYSTQASITVGSASTPPPPPPPPPAPPPGIVENVALSAVAQASSERFNKEASKVNDGSTTVNWNNPVRTFWQTKNEGAGAFIKLSWANPVDISSVVLWDYPTKSDQVSAGTLELSNGQKIAVGTLPNQYRSLTVSFTANNISWIIFHIDQVVIAPIGGIGLLEFEVMGKVSGAAPPPPASPPPAPPPTVSGKLINGGFEQGRNGWQGNTSIYSGSLHAHNGAKALRVVGDVSKQVITRQYVDVIAGNTYDIGGWIKTLPMTSGHYIFVALWRNVNGAKTGRTSFGKTRTQTDYIEYRQQLTAPANTTTLDLMIKAVKADGRAFVDDMFVISVGSGL